VPRDAVRRRGYSRARVTRAITGRRASLLLAALAAAAAFALTAAGGAAADVCSGGAPYRGEGSPPSALLEAVPALSGPRWSLESLPQSAPTNAFSEWGGRQLAYAWYRDTVLWDVSGPDAWWVIPGQGCATGPHGEAYDPEACVLVYDELRMLGYDCRDPEQIAEGGAPQGITSGAATLVSGFAPPGSGSALVTFQHGTATLPASGGVYAGAVSAALGRALSAAFLPAADARPLAPIVLVDQTGEFSPSQGPLASTPRLRRVAEVLRPRLGRATILGTAVEGRRSRDEVLFGPGSQASARRVAAALHAPRPTPLGAGALAMFGDAARVVVLVGRRD